jgi:hypothetical protein
MASAPERWLLNQYVEAEKAHRQAYEQQRVQYLEAVAGQTLRAAEASATAAKIAAVACLVAAAGTIGQLIVAVIVWF